MFKIQYHEIIGIKMAKNGVVCFSLLNTETAASVSRAALSIGT